MASGTHTSLSAPYRISVAAVLLCGALAAVLLYRDARRDEDQDAETEFARRASVRHALTREVLGRYAESLFGLSTLFTVNTEVPRTDFIRATARVGRRLPGVLAFEWVPVIRHEDRAATEAAMQRLYPHRHFEFVEFDAVGRPRRAGDRPIYYPICYLEPLQGNEVALGYDVMTAPTRPFLERAKESRQMCVSGQFRLVQEKQQQLGLVMILPVYRSTARTAPGMEPTDGPETSEVFHGFLECVFHIRELLETASDAPSESVLDLLFVDASESDPAKRVLYYRPGHEDDATRPAPTEDEFRRGAAFTRELTLPFGERDWRVFYRPQADWLRAQRSSRPALRSASIMSLSALLAGLLVVIGRRTETIRRQVEQRTAELTESRRRYASFLHALPGMAYRSDYAHDSRIDFASEGALALTGWAADEFVAGAVRLRDIVHPDDLEQVRAATRAALDSHRDIELEYRIRTRNGEEKWVLSRGRGVYNEQGQSIGVEGLLIDITEARRAEAARLAIERKLLETQKLESLGLLAGGIAHDFNNLLSAVLGNASLARMSLEPTNPADPQLRAIETAALRAAELCRQMLAYAGKGRFVVERVDLSALVEDLLPLLRVSIARSATLHLELTHNLSGVKADATQLRQIVMNLVLNAVDSLADRNGAITIRTGMVAVDKALLAGCVTGTNLPLGDYVYLEVTDTGCGMTLEVLSKIFDPFFTTKFSGRGLGLAAVLGIVRGHNGALLVESEVNRGTKFRLFLPPIVAEAHRPDAPVPEPAKPWRQSGDVLVIEDEEPVRIVMVEMLKSFGFNAHAVPDGRTGIGVFRENASRWTLVVIDLLMPGMSGEATLGALRAIKSDVRVLLMSGYAEGDILNRASGAGAGRIAFLPKPFKRESFEAKLKELFA